MIGFDKIILYTQGWARSCKCKNVAPPKQNAICKLRALYAKCKALLNYLKRIAPQQLMLRTQVFKKIINVQFRRFQISAGFELRSLGRAMLTMLTMLQVPLHSKIQFI
jgi:hypothetical protein